MFPIGLKPFCEFYKNLESGLNRFEAFLQKLQKEIENRKGKEEKKIKTETDPGGTHLARHQNRPTAC
jgi:Skp family chaperone for outer membrane proteins